jgi:hypothetical protein
MDKNNDHRYGIVPRYACDDAAWEKRAKQKYGQEARKEKAEQKRREREQGAGGGGTGLRLVI